MQNTGQRHTKEIKCELYNDHFQNYKRYQIPKAQLVIADIPYNIGKNAYGSNPMWYNGGDNKTANQNTQTALFLIPMKTLILQSICTFAIPC